MTSPFQYHVAEYEEWFEKYPYVFRSELAAIKKIWPAKEELISLEIGSATGRFAQALGIKECIDVSPNMAAIAEARGVNTTLGFADDLPYLDGQFDVVLMTFCISYLKHPQKVLSEVFRVLKDKGCFILGFIDKHSRIGNQYEKNKDSSIFYNNARFYTVKEIQDYLLAAGFTNLSFSQTLFAGLDTTVSIEESIGGYGKGSYVLVRAVKNMYEDQNINTGSYASI